MSDDDRLDLSALDPGADPTRLDRSADVIARRIAPALRRRREQAPALWLQLAGWLRPVTAAGALVAAASIVVLALAPRATSLPVNEAPTLAEAEGVPAELAGLLESRTASSAPATRAESETP